MRTHQEAFLNTTQGEQIYYQAWFPQAEPKAVLLLVHGLAEHSGRYLNLVEHFVPKGYAIYALDHYGHGKSAGERVYVPRFEVFTDTIKDIFDQIQANNPDKPVFIVGHSMGGLITADYLLDHQDELAGAVLSGPAVKKPDNISAFTVTLSRLLSKLVPKAGVVQLDAKAVSRDPAVVQAYINDPLVYTGKTTARLSAEMLRALLRIQAQASQIKLPVLIMQGSEDQLVDPSGARDFYHAISSSDKTLRMYAGLYHEIFNEPEHPQVLSEMESWLEERLPVD